MDTYFECVLTGCERAGAGTATKGVRGGRWCKDASNSVKEGSNGLVIVCFGEVAGERGGHLLYRGK